MLEVSRPNSTKAFTTVRPQVKISKCDFFLLNYYHGHYLYTYMANDDVKCRVSIVNCQYLMDVSEICN